MRLIIVFLMLGTAQGFADVMPTEARLEARSYLSKQSYLLRAGMGWPDLFSLQLDKRLSADKSLGLGMGILPIGLFNIFGSLKPFEISESYTISVKPGVNIVSPSAYFQYHPWGTETYLKLQFTLLLLNVDATADLNNLTNGRATSVANVEATVFQPIMSLAIAKPLWTTDDFRLEGGLGVSYLLASSIKMNVSGTLPEYMDVVPESQENIEDGLRQAQDDISKTLNELTKKPAILPAFFLQAAW